TCRSSSSSISLGPLSQGRLQSDRTTYMADNASRRGATNLGTPLMIVAFVVIGGFIYWLSSQASADIAERQALADSIAAADAERARLEDLLISPEALQRDAEPFEGREVRLEGMPVASALGTQGYWIEMP